MQIGTEISNRICL